MTQGAPAAMAKAPVCGMDIDPAAAKYASEYRGQTYFFCSLMCKRAFEDNPGHYLGKGRPAGVAPSAGT